MILTWLLALHLCSTCGYHSTDVAEEEADEKIVHASRCMPPDHTRGVVVVVVICCKLHKHCESSFVYLANTEQRPAAAAAFLWNKPFALKSCALRDELISVQKNKICKDVKESIDYTRPPALILYIVSFLSYLLIKNYEKKIHAIAAHRLHTAVSDKNRSKNRLSC